MREIVIDTETTGLDPLGGHRIVEIGAVELVDHSPTGRTQNEDVLHLSPIEPAAPYRRPPFFLSFPPPAQ